MTLKMKAGCRRRRGVEKKNSTIAVGMRNDERTVPNTRNLRPSSTTLGEINEEGKEGLHAIAGMERWMHWGKGGKVATSLYIERGPGCDTPVTS